MAVKKLTSETLEKISSSLREVLNGNKEFINILPFPTSEDSNSLEAVLFLKPEIVSNISAQNFEKLIPLIVENVARWNLDIVACLVLGAKYLERYEIISNHYGVINKISQQGFDALSDDAKRNLAEKFKDELAQQPKIMGGHQFLSQFKDMSPKTLDIIVSNLGVTKIGPGSYCTKVKVDGNLHLLLNGFHPYQIEHFTSNGRAIVVFLLKGQGNWKKLRESFLGATNPSNAEEGSIRRILLDQKDSFGIKQIDQGNNGVHFSAGPLEGMVETIRYFTDYQNSVALGPSDTTFGQLLLAQGFQADEINYLMKNPTLNFEDKRISAFDLTEEKQPEDAVSLLKSTQKEAQ